MYNWWSGSVCAQTIGPLIRSPPDWNSSTNRKPNICPHFSPKLREESELDGEQTWFHLSWSQLWWCVCSWLRVVVLWACAVTCPGLRCPACWTAWMGWVCPCAAAPRWWPAARRSPSSSLRPADLWFPPHGSWKRHGDRWVRVRRTASFIFLIKHHSEDVSSLNNSSWRFPQLVCAFPAQFNQHGELCITVLVKIEASRQIEIPFWLNNDASKFIDDRVCGEPRLNSASCQPVVHDVFWIINCI